MSGAEVSEILKLPAEERLRLVELIWGSLASTPAGVPLAIPIEAVLDERLAEHDRSPDDVVVPR